MKFAAKIMNVPRENTVLGRTDQELLIEAGSHEEAIEKAVDECTITGDERDTLVVWVTPLEERESDALIESFLSALDRPLSREECLRRASRAEDEGQRKWWEEEAAVFRPEAEGGGVTSEEDYQANRERRHQRARDIAATLPPKEKA
jgi:hypothetical protein